MYAPTLRRLVSKVLTASNIPFHGEPAIGMQVMGVLETVTLTFAISSFNEGQLPKSGGDSSFIPYNLRKLYHSSNTKVSMPIISTD